MRIIQVHNWHRFGGGSETVVRETTRLLREKNHEVLLEVRDSRKLGRGASGRVMAFLCGIYCPSGRKAMARLVREYKPDLVHVHELYPFFSPWALVECRRAGVPVVMTCHDCRFTCPVTIHWRKGTVCRLCAGGHEYWCMVKNCRGNVFESGGYALRSFVARKWGLFKNNVSRYIAPTEFIRGLMVEAGLPAELIAVVPNMVSVPSGHADPSFGTYIAYAGRISHEKGVDTLLASARMTGLPVCLAGDYSPMPELVSAAPQNVSFVGHLNKKELLVFYRNARCLVVPSISLESFGIVIAEAMAQGLPVIASRIGGIPEVVDDGVTGILFEPGNAEDLSDKMIWLWEHDDVCRQMGLAGREKAIREYSEGVHYQRLMDVYQASVKKRVNYA